MSLEKELDSIINGLTRLRDSAHKQRMDDASQAVRQLIIRIDQLHNAIQEATDEIVDATKRQSIDVQGQFVDIIGMMNRQSAMVSMIAEKIDTAGDRSSQDAAVQALIVTHDQLSRLVAASADEAAAITGQCANLELTLTHLGVVPIDTSPHGSFDPEIMISDTQTVPTPDAKVDGRVAEQIRTGWRNINDGSCIRVARVKLYSYNLASETADAALSSIVADDPVATERKDDLTAVAGDSTAGQTQLEAGEQRG